MLNILELFYCNTKRKATSNFGRNGALRAFSGHFEAVYCAYLMFVGIL